MSNRVLGLDVGKKRIGVSFAGDGLSVARSLPTIENTAQGIDEIHRLVTSEKVNKIVVGLPRSLEGNDTPQTDYVKMFTSEHLENIGVEIAFQDEALTSSQAEANLDKMGGNFKKGDIDRLSALTILQDYIDEKGL